MTEENTKPKDKQCMNAIEKIMRDKLRNHLETKFFVGNIYDHISLPTWRSGIIINSSYYVVKDEYNLTADETNKILKNVKVITDVMDTLYEGKTITEAHIAILHEACGYHLNWYVVFAEEPNAISNVE